MAAMETEEWIEEDEGVAAQRARARNLLPQITQQVKQALHEASIEIDVFLMIPTTGDAIATFGTLADPPDELWNRIGEIVCAVLGNTIGLDRAISRELACANTGDISGHLTSSADLHAKANPTPTSMAPTITGEAR
jgi:hypothetical protein